MRSLMNNMQTCFSKDVLVFVDVHTPRSRPAKRDIATLYSTDVSYQLKKSALSGHGKLRLSSDNEVTALMRFHQYTR